MPVSARTPVQRPDDPAAGEALDRDGPVDRPGLAERVQDLVDTLRDWPWSQTFRTLAERFREDRLGLTAGSLTFTTLIALVPLVTVALAVFSAFPMFANLQDALERQFVRALVPDGIARPVLRLLMQFTDKASRLGALGFGFLVATSLALMMTMDRSLNAIWRVRRPRPIGQRLLVYWAALTLGPLLMGLSLTLTSTAVSTSRGLMAALPGGVSLLLNGGQFLMLAAAMAGLFHYVPNTHVRWRHAWAGGLFVAAGLALAEEGLAWYVSSVPTFAAVYGAFATGPILLLWIYLVWVIVLLGAVVAAYAPSLQMGLRRPDRTPGAAFEQALAVLRVLSGARAGPPHGLTVVDLAASLRLDPLAVEVTLDRLMQMGWVGRLDEPGAQRHAMLCDPGITPAGPLIHALLLRQTPVSEPLMQRAGLHAWTLADLLDADLPATPAQGRAGVRPPEPEAMDQTP
ncbi:MAG: YihY family inner membrane protein [Rubrivivax sp.]